MPSISMFCWYTANLAFHQLMQGPLDGIQLGTGSYEAIRLIALLKKACQTMEASLWPVMRLLLEDLSHLGDDG
jgi:hypothetical protein